MERVGSVLSPGLGKLWLATGPRVEQNGTVEQRFRKDLIRVGKYVKAEDGIEFEVRAQDNQHFAAEFARMKANGVKVPVPDDHSNAGKADHNRGWVEDLFVEGDTLVGIMRIIGEDAIQTVQRSDVSIFVPFDLADGHGNRYQRPIEHVALTSKPLVPGLGQFIPLAASKEAHMTKLEFAKKLGKALRLAKEITDENAEELLEVGIKELIEARDKAAADLKSAQDETAKATADLEQVKIAASRKPDPMLVKLAADNATLKLGALVPHRISAAVRDKLAAVLIGKDNARLALTLSRGDDLSLVEGVVDALSTNETIKTGEKTGAQVPLSLSAGGNEADKPSIVKDAERRQKDESKRF